jgi:predicted small secreted protein
MKSRISAALLLACVLTAGCDLLTGKGKDDSSSTPTSPTTSSSIDAFAGTWTSATPSTPPTGCGNLKYTITPTTTTSANVTFSATCAGNITVTGSGNGTLSGSTITWSATGLVGQGGVNCPFTFNNSKATLGTAGEIIVNYTGTVCGIPVSGSETVKK